MAKWWAMPRSVVLAIGMDHGTVKPPEPSQRRAIQWLLLSVLLRPGTPNWKELGLEGSASPLHVAERKTGRREHCKAEEIVTLSPAV